MSCSRTQHGGGRSRTPDLSLRVRHSTTEPPRSPKNICGYSLELPGGDSNEYPRRMFLWRNKDNWAVSSEFSTFRLCEQRRFRWACASAQSRQYLLCSLIEAVCQEDPSDRKPDPLPLWMSGHVQLKFIMTECSKTQIRWMRQNYPLNKYHKKPTFSVRLFFCNFDTYLLVENWTWYYIAD